MIPLLFALILAGCTPGTEGAPDAHGAPHDAHAEAGHAEPVATEGSHDEPDPHAAPDPHADDHAEDDHAEDDHAEDDHAPADAHDEPEGHGTQPKEPAHAPEPEHPKGHADPEEPAPKPAPGHAAPDEDPPSEPTPPAVEPAEPEELTVVPDVARLKALLNAAVIRVVLAVIVLAGIRFGATAAIGRLPHLAREIAVLRFGGTALVLLALTGALAGLAQRGGAPVVLGGLVTATVAITALAVLWAPRYLDGLWVALRATYEGTGEVAAGDVRGTLSDVGLFRIRLHHADGRWTSVPIWSLGGAAVHSDDHGVFQVTVDAADPEAAAASKRRATLSPYRDPRRPVEVLQQDGRLVVRAVSWGPEAAQRLAQALSPDA